MRSNHLIPFTARRALRPAYTLGTDVNRLVGDLFEGFAPFFADEAGLAPEGRGPRLDVTESATEVRIEAELPGVEPGDVEVTFDAGTLVLRGEKRQAEEAEGENYRHVERRFGAFERRLNLPFDVAEDSIEATFKNGILAVRVPKAPETSARKIDVKRLD